MKIRETEFVKLAGLEAALKKKVIGQDEAVHLVAQAIKRSRADLSGRRRPASFIFVGPPAWVRPSWSSSWQNSCSTVPTHLHLLLSRLTYLEHL